MMLITWGCCVCTTLDGMKSFIFISAAACERLRRQQLYQSILQMQNAKAERLQSEAKKEITVSGWRSFLISLTCGGSEISLLSTDERSEKVSISTSTFMLIKKRRRKNFWLNVISFATQHEVDNVISFGEKTSNLNSSSARNSTTRP